MNLGLWEALFVAACAVLFVVPIVFVHHRVYNDGLVGRFALVGISSMAGLVLLESFFGRGYGISAEVSLLVVSFACFIAWHLWRFHRRVVLEQARAEHIGPVGLR